MVYILTEREEKIIRKKVAGHRLSQNESNILSKSIRPKLKAINKLNPEEILVKIEYNQKGISIEKKIKKIILDSISGVDSIVLCGSAIQNNYRNYNDIDVIVALRKQISNKKKKEIIEKIENAGKMEGLNLDVQIYSKKSILSESDKNPSLIYQLKDSKTIYGKLKMPKKIKPSNLELRMKLDWSEGIDINSKGEEIYYAIRNAMLVSLLMNKKVDNYKLRENMHNLLWIELSDKLRNNSASKIEKKLALSYLNLLVKHLENKLKNSKWEKIEIETP